MDGNIVRNEGGLDGTCNGTIVANKSALVNRHLLVGNEMNNVLDIIGDVAQRAAESHLWLREVIRQHKVAEGCGNGTAMDKETKEVALVVLVGGVPVLGAPLLCYTIAVLADERAICLSAVFQVN